MMILENEKAARQVLISIAEEYVIDAFKDSSRIPPEMRMGLWRWLMWGIKPGGFLSSVIKNDLISTFEYADFKNSGIVRDYIEFVKSYFPGASYGSEQRFNEWHRAGGYMGKYGKVKPKEAANG